MPREQKNVPKYTEYESTDTGHKDGLLASYYQASAMDVERRDLSQVT